MCENLDYYHEHSLQTFRFNPHLPLQLIPPIAAPLPSEPVLTLTLTREGDPTVSTYVCTPRGVVNSLRRGQKGEIYVGRLMMLDDGNYANDIVMRASDYQVSRRHCCVYYGQGLGPRPLTEEVLALLMGRHARLGANSAVSRLPTELLSVIVSFLMPKRAVYITDCGSLYGTYVRASAFFPLSIASFVLTSPSSGFHVISATWAYSILLSARSAEVRNGRGSDFSTEAYKDFPVLWLAMAEGDPTYRMVEGKIIALTPAHGQRFLIEARSSDPDPQPAAVVEFHNNEWFISESGNSAFGVWLSTSLARRLESRYTPRWVEIKSGTEVRVSTSVIRIDW